MRVLVVAPHPDDEILGCGGVLAKMSAAGDETFVGIITKAGPPLFTEELVVRGREEAGIAHQLLGVKETFFCDLPAAALDAIPHSQANQVISQLINQVRPDVLFVPFLGDIHLDHQYAFLSALVASRPNNKIFPKKILAYETLSETNWNAPYLTAGFHPNVFFDISNYIDLKLKAFSCYQSQIQEFPHERSLIALDALAKLRGATIFTKAAEAFVLIRDVIN